MEIAMARRSLRWQDGDSDGGTKTEIARHGWRWRGDGKTETEMARRR